MTTQAKLFTELIQDRKRFIEALLWIENKSSQRIPFILNPIQQDVHRTQTGRDIYVKPAQVGFSSERLATRLIDTITNPGTNTVLIAYEEFITQRLLDKAQFFYNGLNSMGIPGLPQMHHRSSFEKTFPDIHSSMYISSARSYVAGRAETIHHLLADEHAFWEPGATERILGPAIDRVPADGTVDIFSTPNGESNDFHGMCMLAKEGKSVFTYHFYPWFMHPEYAMGVDHPILVKSNSPVWTHELREYKLDLDVAIDPGQAKVTQTAIVVLSFVEDRPIYCARAAGLWGPETTVHKAVELAKYYNNAMITWEANSHGLAIAPLMKDYPNVYFRRDVISGRESSELGWLTTPKTKDFMLHTMSRMLNIMTVHDMDFISECRNIRLAGDKVISTGADDIHDAVAIGLVCRDSRPIQRGFVGASGYKW